MLLQNSKFKKNLKYALIAQTISAIFSMIMYLIVPKMMDITSYGYWQLFILYTNYSGFFHLGLVDGIYLKNGGKQYSSLNKVSLGSQLKIMSLFHLCIGLLGVLAIFNIGLEKSRVFVCVCCVIYIVLYCIQNFLGFVFQAVNNTSVYSLAIIVEKAIDLVGVTILVVKRESDFSKYVIVYLFAIFINCALQAFAARDILFLKFILTKQIFIEMMENIKVGSILMLSSIAGALITGIGRFAVDIYWGLESFGQISFSISMLNLLLLFIRQIGMVLFPALRQIDYKQQLIIYQKILGYMGILLPLSYICYIPLKMLLSLWLPQYMDSIMYLNLLLPICLYEGKMQLIFNTYFKVLRFEKKLLLLNLCSLGISFVLCFTVCIFTNQITYIAVCILIGIGFRSILAQVILSHNLKCNNKIHTLNIILEIFLSGLLMIISWGYSSGITIICSFLALIVYSVWCFGLPNMTKKY